MFYICVITGNCCDKLSGCILKQKYLFLLVTLDRGRNFPLREFRKNRGSNIVFICQTSEGQFSQRHRGNYYKKLDCPFKLYQHGLTVPPSDPCKLFQLPPPVILPTDLKKKKTTPPRLAEQEVSEKLGLGLIIDLFFFNLNLYSFYFVSFPGT